MQSPGLWTGRGPMMPQHQGADPSKQGYHDCIMILILIYLYFFIFVYSI